MDEDEFEGDAIADLLARPGAAAILAALPGCSAYRDDPDAAMVIRSCDPHALQIHVEDRAGHVRAYPLRGRSLALLTQVRSDRPSENGLRMRRITGVEDEI